MTWVEAIPATAITFGLLVALFKTRSLVYHWDYRGPLDKRVPYRGGYLRNRCYQYARLYERDHRLALFPTEVEWVHDLWRPSNYPAKSS